MSLAQVRVAFAEESKLSWQLLKDTPGFGGVDIPGIYQQLIRYAGPDHVLSQCFAPRAA